MDALKQVWPEWEIESQLGQGSYGTVYQAVRRDHNVESHAAIKVIPIPSNASEVDSLRSEGLDMYATRTYLQGVVDNFVSEIQIMESLKGAQNIVNVEDYKVVEKTDTIGWDIYIRMELLTPFNVYLCNRQLSEADVIKLGCDICTALEICKKRNIIHRDIKPENIFVNEFGDFKLGDFGIARKMEHVTGGLSQRGTPYYMAPEVSNSSEYDARVDIYSLGIMLYRLLNGNRLPFLETEQQLVNPNERKNAVERRMRGEALPAPCDASPAMTALILRACAYDPNVRFSSAAEMKQALINAAHGVQNEKSDALNQTVSVRRKAQQNPNDTVSVRRASQAPDGCGVHPIGSFGEPKKAANPSKIAAIVLSIALLISVVGFAVHHFASPDEDAEDEGSSSSDASSVSSDRSGMDDASALSDKPAVVIGSTVRFELKTDEAGTESAIITGVSQRGEIAWTHVTGTYPQAEVSNLKGIGMHDGGYYFVENGTICVLNVKDGSVVWSNHEFGGCVSDWVFDDRDQLYLCGYYGPDLFIVDQDGNTVKSIASFDDEYMWPYQLACQDGQLAITYEETPSGESEIVYVSLSDYSTSIKKESIPPAVAPPSVPQNPPAAAIGNAGTPTVTMSAVSGIYASSVLEDSQYGYTYEAANLTDGDLTTAWVEGVSGYGEGESITFMLDSTYLVSGFTIHAGYQKNADIYAKNTRPASLYVEFQNGDTVTADLEDYYGQQTFTFQSPVTTSSVTFILSSFYGGTKYEDTAISEITLF